MSKKIYNQFECSSMMLPEHREALKKMTEEELFSGEKITSLTNEEELERFDALIDYSLKEKAEIKLQIKKSGESPCIIMGVVTDKNLSAGIIWILSAGTFQKIAKNNILKIDKK